MSYYTILGIQPNANQKEIKAAYHRLARQYHPDINPHPAAEERFKQINAAYEVLGTPKKRRFYDFECRQATASVHQTTSADYRSTWSHNDWQSQTTSSPFSGKFTIEELNVFVIMQLQQRLDRDTIIQAVCDKADLSWLQAAGFVRYAEIIYRCEMAERRRYTNLGIYATTSFSGVLLTCLMSTVFVDFYQSNAGFAGTNILVSVALVFGGILGMTRTLRTR